MREHDHEQAVRERARGVSRGTAPTHPRRWGTRASRLVRRRRARPRRPVEPLHLPEPDEREAHRVLNFTLLAGEVLLAAGAGASDVTATIMAAANACGLTRVEVDVSYTSITVSYVRSADVAPVTSMRIVRRRSLDYTRVVEVHNLIHDLSAGRLGVDAAITRLDTIRHAPHPYRRWAVTAYFGATAAAIVLFLGGGLAAAGVAALLSTVVDVVTRWMALRGAPQFFQNAVGAALSTLTAAGLVAGGVPLSSSLVIAGGIILLLPGAILVGAVQDGITGYMITAAARATETILLSAAIIAGVGASLYAAASAGVTVPVSDTSTPISELPLQVFAAGCASACYALAYYAPRRLVASAGLAGALGWGTFQLLSRATAGPTLATAAAACLVGAGAYVLAGRQKAPPLVIVTAGIVPLLPGLTVYEGLFALSQGDPLLGVIKLVQALTIGLALAAGALLGEFMAQPARRNVARFERRLAGPRLAGPLAWRDEDETRSANVLGRARTRSSPRSDR